MALDDLKEVDTGKDVSNETNIRMDRNAVQELKSEVGASQNSEVSPAVEAAVYAYIGNEDAQTEAEERFREQFEDQ